MINIGGFEKLYQISRGTIIDIIIENLKCSDLEDIPCTFHTSFDFCKSTLNVKAGLIVEYMGWGGWSTIYVSLEQDTLDGSRKISISLRLTIHVSSEEDFDQYILPVMSSNCQCFLMKMNLLEVIHH